MTPILEYTNENVNHDVLIAVSHAYGCLIDEKDDYIRFITFNDESEIVKYVLDSENMVFNRYIPVEEFLNE